VDVAVGIGVEVRVGIRVGNSKVAVGVAGLGVAEGGMTVSMETHAFSPAMARSHRLTIQVLLLRKLKTRFIPQSASLV
jgi:hypothetical protein